VPGLAFTRTKKADGVADPAARYGRWLCLTVLTLLLDRHWAGSFRSSGWDRDVNPASRPSGENAGQTNRPESKKAADW